MKQVLVLALLALTFSAKAQAISDSATVQTPKKLGISGELNLSLANLWLLNGAVYGKNEVNVAATAQATYGATYAYVYKATSLNQRVSEGNYVMLAVGNKHEWARTALDLSVTGMYTQRHRFDGFVPAYTQYYFTAFATRQLRGVHYLNVQPSYVVNAGADDRSGDNWLVRADYEGRYKWATLNVLYYFYNGMAGTDAGSRAGVALTHTLAYSKRISEKIVLVGLKNLGGAQSPFSQDALSLG